MHHPKEEKAGAPALSRRPVKIKVAPSQIPNAGLGLYVLEDVKKDQWIARYSGTPLTKAESKQHGHSHYRLQVHSNLFLDAKDLKHFEGRYINDATRSKFKVNARFAANYITETDSATGFKWVRIYATRNIKAGEEIFLSYGKEFWDNTTRNAVTRNTTRTTNQNTPTPTESTLGSNSKCRKVPSPQPATNNQSPSYTSRSSIDVWAASAYIPGDSPPNQTTNNTHQTIYDTRHTNITTTTPLITHNTHTSNRHSTPLLTPHHSYHTPTNANNHLTRCNLSRTPLIHTQSLRPRIMGHHYPSHTHTPFNTPSLSPIISTHNMDDMNDTRLL